MFERYERPTNTEFRTCTIDIDTRDITPKGEWGGYANRSDEIDSYRTRFPKGAWADSIQSRGKIPILDMHQKSVIVGESRNLTEDSKGLLIEGRLYLGNIRRADEMLFLMQERTVNAMSVGFDLNDIDQKHIEYNRTDDAVDIRKANLNEISLVTKNFPSNKGSLITYVRALGVMTQDERMESGDMRVAFKRITALLEELLKLQKEDIAADKDAEDRSIDVIREFDFERFTRLYNPQSVTKQFAEVIEDLRKKVAGN